MLYLFACLFSGDSLKKEETPCMTLVWFGWIVVVVEPDLRVGFFALESMVDLSEARWLSCCSGVYLLILSLGIISELEAL